MAFSDPVENIKHLSLKEGSKVADFGAGSGHYTLAAAKVVHASGQVIAIDVQKDILGKIQSSARENGLHNVQVVWGDIDKAGGSKLRDGTVDAVIVSNILFQSERKDDLAKEAFRVLRQKGEVLLIDWTDSYGGLGPDPAHIVSEDEGVAVFEKAGFKLKKNFSAGEHHWGVVMAKL